MECEKDSPSNTKVAPGLRGSGPRDVATFQGFARHIFPGSSLPVYHNTSKDDIKNHKLDSVTPDPHWIAEHNWAPAFAGPELDPERIHSEIEAQREGITDMDICNAVKNP